jgi:hypothetical protein
MDDWAWEHVRRWTEHRVLLPIGPLFSILAGATRGPRVVGDRRPRGASPGSRPRPGCDGGSRRTSYGTTTRSRCRTNGSRCRPSRGSSDMRTSRSRRSSSKGSTPARSSTRSTTADRPSSQRAPACGHDEVQGGHVIGASRAPAVARLDIHDGAAEGATHAVRERPRGPHCQCSPRRPHRARKQQRRRLAERIVRVLRFDEGVAKSLCVVRR